MKSVYAQRAKHTWCIKSALAAFLQMLCVCSTYVHPVYQLHTSRTPCHPSHPSPHPLSPLPFLPMMQYQECDQVIKEYKEMLEKARLKAEQEEKLRQMAIKVCMCVLQCKVQNWYVLPCSSQKRREETEEGWSGVACRCNEGDLQCSYVPSSSSWTAVWGVDLLQYWGWSAAPVLCAATNGRSSRL